MNKKFGKKEAGDTASNSGLITIVSMLVVALFIGVAVQPMISGTISNVNDGQTMVEEEHISCGCGKPGTKDTDCKTCSEAVFHAVKYMKDYVNNYIQYLKRNGFYPLWTMDLTIEIVEGLTLGVLDSGFKIKINMTELGNTIQSWVNTLYGPQVHFITRVTIMLFAIYVGITWYLLTLCY
jgi:hypothetical protein